MVQPLRARRDNVPFRPLRSLVLSSTRPTPACTHVISIHATCVYAGLYFSAQTVVEGTSNVGEFVSVNTYMMNLFTPLYFLGTVYNIIIQVRRRERGACRFTGLPRFGVSRQRPAGPRSGFERCVLVNSPYASTLTGLPILFSAETDGRGAPWGETTIEAGRPRPVKPIVHFPS